MNKALILSVKPQHAYNILTGKKTLELRKSVPKGYKGWVYVYVTFDKEVLEKSYLGYRTLSYRAYDTQGIGVALNGTIPFRFWFDEWEKVLYINYGRAGAETYQGNNKYNNQGLFDELCLSLEQALDYGKGKNLYAWHIKDLEIFDKPMQLNEFIKDFPYASRDVILSEIKNQKLRIKKAPRPYMYAWVKEELK